MFLLFDEPVAECWNDVEVEVIIDDVHSSEFCVKTLADWVNPYTYTFIAPGTKFDGKVQGRNWAWAWGPKPPKERRSPLKL